MGWYTKIVAYDIKYDKKVKVAEMLDRKIFGYFDDEKIYRAAGYIAMNTNSPDLDITFINEPYCIKEVYRFLDTFDDIRKWFSILCEDTALPIYDTLMVELDQFRSDVIEYKSKVPDNYIVFNLEFY